MNILLITKNYPPAVCGVGDHSFHLKREWEKMGHQVFILTTGVSRQEQGIFTTASNEFNGSILPDIRKLTADLHIGLIFWQYVPFSYQRKGWPLWWPRLVKKLQALGMDQAVYFHEVAHRVWGYGPRQMITALIQRYIANSVNNNVTAAFTSIPLYQFNFFGRKPALVPVGANLPYAEASPVPCQLFCFTNRVDQALLDAMTLLRAEFPVRLVIAGHGNSQMQEKLAQWVSDRSLQAVVQQLGVLPEQELAGCIASAQIYLQPQVVERGSEGGISAKNGTIMAAMQMAKPIISTVGDMTDPGIFQHGKNILFVPYGNADRYAAAIRQLFLDEHLCDQLGKAARHSWQQIAEWPEIASSLLGNARYIQQPDPNQRKSSGVQQPGLQ